GRGQHLCRVPDLPGNVAGYASRAAHAANRQRRHAEPRHHGASDATPTQRRGCQVAPIYRTSDSTHAAITARSSAVISVTLPGGIALAQAALRPMRRALRWM